MDVTQKAGGTCVDDFNEDGYLDIITSSWGFDDQIKYFENDKAGGFTDKTFDAGLKGVTGGLNLRHADYNNDGLLDFIILRGAWLTNNGNIPNSLMRNNGDGTFTDVTMESGIYSLNPTQTAVWTDINLDGWVDLFIANEWSQNKQSQCELFLNQADGTFKNIIKEAGINATGFFKGVATGDINNDMYPDLYLSNYSGPNTLYINTTKETGRPSFRIATQEAGVFNPIHSFPTWIFDYNNDGFEDIFVSGYSSATILPSEMMIRNIKTNSTDYRPFLYKNNGNGTFTEVSLKVNLNEPIATMGCNFGDLDNDGFLDFYLATGDPSYFSIVPNRMYHNVNGEKFEDVTYSAGFGHIQKGHAIGFGDMDLDGDQDIYTVMGGAFEGDVFGNLLFENPIGNKNNWINIILEGKRSNRLAMGAKIIVTIQENGKKRNIYHSVGTDASFGGNSIMAEIGLGKASVIEKIEIKWPHFLKETTIFENVKSNQTIKIIEGMESIKTLSFPKTSFKNNNGMEMPHHNHH
ncbi:MAG: CRTAC1 family protein [Flavobacteriales bacterium]